MTEKSIEEYVKKNEKTLKNLAKHSEKTVRAMALAILKKGKENSSKVDEMNE